MRKTIGFEISRGNTRAFILFELNSFDGTDQISCQELFRTDSEGRTLSNTTLYNYLVSVARYNFHIMPFIGRRINFTEGYLIGMGLFDDGSERPLEMNEAIGEP